MISSHFGFKTIDRSNKFSDKNEKIKNMIKGVIQEDFSSHQDNKCYNNMKIQKKFKALIDKYKIFEY